MSHACSFDPAADRHPTPPLSPSLSSGSSRESSAPSFSTTSSSLHLPRDIDGLHPNYPDPQPLGHSNPVIELARMPHGLGEDTVMLDEWEGEGKREERDHDTSLDSQPDPLSFPLQLGSSTFSDSVSCPRRPSLSQRQSQRSEQPSTDVIDVAKLARQDQPPTAYENVDERPSSLASRTSRPLPRPPIDRLTSSSSTHSVGLMTDSGPAGPHETPSQSSLSAPICTDPMVPTSHPFSTLAGTSQPPSVSVGMLPPLDPSSQDQLNRSAGISPLSSQSPFSTFPPRTPSEPSQQSALSSSFNHDSLWTMNQTVSGAQQETSRLTASVSPRPISSPGFIETLSPPPLYSPSEASQSRTGRHLSDSSADMRSTHRPRPSLPTPSSRGLPPPAPPTVLDPPPAHSNSVRGSRAPHEPFLSDATPPDSWIAVETSSVEYRLVVRLPGFRRDAITLAARRRRVLHVVADSWEPGGGHFERRISFGYDADLGHVRAEFDGETLRVIVPRRTPPLTWYGAACE